VVALPAAKSSWPPFAERPSTKNVRPLEGPIVLPSRNSGQAWFATRVLLRNEGSTTGIISLPDDDSMRFANDGGAFGRARVAEPVRVSGGLFALTPGHEALLEITSCATFAHLADLADPTVDPPIVSAHNITILDYFRETVLTNIRFELRGRPLEKVPDDPGRWRPTERLAIDPTPVVTMGVWIDRHRASQV